MFNVMFVTKCHKTTSLGEHQDVCWTLYDVYLVHYSLCLKPLHWSVYVMWYILFSNVLNPTWCVLLFQLCLSFCCCCCCCCWLFWFCCWCWCCWLLHCCCYWRYMLSCCCLCCWLLLVLVVNLLVAVVVLLIVVLLILHCWIKRIRWCNVFLIYPLSRASFSRCFL